jgi:hypothetical protein
LQQEGKPGLQAQVEEAQLFMQKVEVEVDALAPLQFEFEPFGDVVAAGEPGAAGFDATEHRDQAGADAITLGDLTGERLLGGAAGGQVDHRPLLGLGQRHRALTDALGEAGGEGFEMSFQSTPERRR